MASAFGLVSRSTPERRFTATPTAMALASAARVAVRTTTNVLTRAPTPTSDGKVLAVPNAGFRRPDDPFLGRAVLRARRRALGLQPSHPGQQGLQADAHQVGQPRFVLAGGVRAADDLTGNPDDHRTCRDLLDHDGVGADPAVVADFDRAQNLGSGANGHAVTDGGVSFPDFPTGAAEGDAVEDRDVLAHLSGFPDYHSGRVVDEQARAEHRTGMDFDTSQDPGEFSEHSRGQPGIAVPQPVADPVTPDGVHSWIGKDDL